MLTLDGLKARGAHVEEGLSRCMNNEAFYLKLVGMALQDGGFATLKTALEQGDCKTAFEASHALKGVLGNLSLTPLFDAASTLTELFRNKAAGDPVPPEAAPAAEALFAAYADFSALL